jgi:hypothetical protein
MPCWCVPLIDTVAYPSLVFRLIMLDRVDVGGGSVLNETRNSLARISLRWMIHECFRTETGIQFRPESLEALGMEPVGTHHSSREKLSQSPWGAGDVRAREDTSAMHHSLTSAEAPAFATRDEEERADALSPMHDQLEMVKAWWILEWLPLRHRRQYEGLGTPRHYWSYVPYHNKSQSTARDD